MSPTVISVLSIAESLTVPERHELIDRLMDGLPDQVAEPPALSEAWKREIARRSAELDAGEAATVDWKEIQARWQQRSGRGG